MIKVFMLLSLMITMNAKANCIGEAQVYGKIAEVRKTLTSCRAFLSNEATVLASCTCPLDEKKLRTEGVEIGLVNGHDCKLEVGDEIFGVVVDNGSFISLE